MSCGGRTEPPNVEEVTPVIGTIDREQAARPGFGARSEDRAVVPPSAEVRSASAASRSDGRGLGPGARRGPAWLALAAILAACIAAAVALAGGGGDDGRAPATSSGPGATISADAVAPTTGTTVAGGPGATSPRADRCAPPIPSWWPCPPDGATR